MEWSQLFSQPHISKHTIQQFHAQNTKFLFLFFGRWVVGGWGVEGGCISQLYIPEDRKIKQSHYRLVQTLRVPRRWGSQISRQSTHDGGKVVSPTHRPSLPPQELFLVLISIRSWVNPRAIVRPEGIRQWWIPITPSGIKPTTFRLVAQCLNQLRYRVPHSTLRAICNHMAANNSNCTTLKHHTYY